MQGCGVSEPLLVDLTHDGIDDVIFQSSSFKAVTIDGASLLQMWNVSRGEEDGEEKEEEEKEEYLSTSSSFSSSPKILPVFYDDDDSLDFVISEKVSVTSNTDPSLKTKLTILDGATGETLSGGNDASVKDADAAAYTGSEHPWRRKTEMARVRVEDYGNDLIIFASTMEDDEVDDDGCAGDAKQCFPSSSSSNYKRLWQPRFRLHVLSAHSYDDDTIIFDSFKSQMPQTHSNNDEAQGEEEEEAGKEEEERTGNLPCLASSKWVNGTQRAMEYVEDHPHLWKLFNVFDNRPLSSRKRDKVDVRQQAR